MSTESRLRWRCRRGIKEMDLLLETFLNDVYPQLNKTEQQSFERFLDEMDLDMLSWITGKTQSGEPAYEKFIIRLRQIRPDDGPRTHE